MRRLAIVGVDTPIGAAMLLHFDGTAEVTGVRMDELAALEEECSGVTDIVVCGDAAISSWDAAPHDAIRDKQYLPDCCQIAIDAGVRLVYISSDAVFQGPWVFHDDNSQHYSRSLTSSEIRSVEQLVLKNPKNLVVRTNAMADGQGSFVDQIRAAFERDEQVSLPANQFATPLAASRLALLLDHILLTPASGVVHVAGAERLSPWSFATQLARHDGADSLLLTPQIGSDRAETSLRCSRARQQFQLRMPTLNQTLDELSSTALQPVRHAA